MNEILSDSAFEIKSHVDYVKGYHGALLMNTFYFTMTLIGAAYIVNLIRALKSIANESYEINNLKNILENIISYVETIQNLVPFYTNQASVSLKLNIFGKNVDFKKLNLQSPGNKNLIFTTSTILSKYKKLFETIRNLLQQTRVLDLRYSIKGEVDSFNSLIDELEKNFVVYLNFKTSGMFTGLRKPIEPYAELVAIEDILMSEVLKDTNTGVHIYQNEYDVIADPVKAQSRNIIGFTKNSTIIIDDISLKMLPLKLSVGDRTIDLVDFVLKFKKISICNQNFALKFIVDNILGLGIAEHLAALAGYNLYFQYIKSFFEAKKSILENIDDATVRHQIIYNRLFSELDKIVVHVNDNGRESLSGNQFDDLVTNRIESAGEEGRFRAQFMYLAGLTSKHMKDRYDCNQDKFIKASTSKDFTSRSSHFSHVSFADIIAPMSPSDLGLMVKQAEYSYILAVHLLGDIKLTVN